MSFPKDRAEMLSQGYALESVGLCRGCHRPMEFWTTPMGKRIPMDPMPTDEARAVSHFATCPEAERFRQKLN